MLQPKVGLQVTASSEKNILIMGGTRFIGVFLSRLLVKEGHQVYEYCQFLVFSCFHFFSPILLYRVSFEFISHCSQFNCFFGR